MKKYIKYSFFGLCYLIIICFLAIMFIASSQAEIIKPNNNIEPSLVIKIQLKGLMKNDQPFKDSGIKQTWEFAHPNNKKNTGPLDKFISMIHSDSYKMLLNHLNHEVKEVKLTNSAAYYEVTILDDNKAYYKFNWQVERYLKEGPLKDCWLTTAVSTPMPLGSSI